MIKTSKLTLLKLSIVAVSFFAALAVLPQDAAAALPAGFSTEVVTDGLSLPTTFDFTPDGRILVAEKGGTVRVVKNGKLLAEPFYELENINTWLDRGLLGLAVDVDFAENGYVYLSYTYENDPTEPEAPKMAQIIRLTADGDVADPDSLTVLVGTEVGDATQPSCNDFATGTDCIPSDSGSHSAGGLRFGPDGYLYATLGDGAGFTTADPNAYKAQNLDWLTGKMLRLSRDGTAPADNPFFTGDPTENRSKVYAYGLRNSYRFNFRPSTGAIYAGEVGWGAAEEVNLMVPGGNYGWPCREGLYQQGSYECVAEDAIDPLYVIDHSDGGGVAAIVGGAFAGAAYPIEYQDDYIFGDFHRNETYRMQVTEANEVQSVETWHKGDAGGPVSMITGPDGSIYFIAIFSGELRRITYEGATVSPEPPVARDDFAVTTVDEPVTLGVLGNDSDPNDDALFVSAIGASMAGGSIVRNGDETLTYTPPAGYVGDDAFAYTVSDGTFTNSATVTIAVQPLGEPSAVSISHEEAAMSDPDPVVGQLVTFSTTFTNLGESGPTLVNFELFDEISGEQEMQKFFPREYLEAGETSSVTIEWVPERAGEYRLALGYTSPDWSILHEWVNEALRFEVFDREPVKEPFALSVTSVETSTSSADIGETVELTTNISNSGRSGVGNVLIAVTDSSGEVVHEAIFAAVSFSQNDTMSFDTAWVPTATGTYYVDSGVFGSEWDTLFDWAWRAQEVEVGGTESPQSLMENVYDDELTASWTDWSWDTGIDFADTDQVASGTRAVLISPNAPWAGFFLHRAPARVFADVSTLAVQLHGGIEGGQELLIKLVAADGSEVFEERLPTLSNEWQAFQIDVSTVPDDTRISGVIIMEATGSTAAPYSLDELRFE